MKITVSLKCGLALGTFLTVLVGAPFAQANTPRGTSGINTGSEIAPINLSPRQLVPTSPNITIDGAGNLVLSSAVQERLNQSATTVLSELRAGSFQVSSSSGAVSQETQSTIASLLQSSDQVFRANEVIGELRVVISERAIPPGETGVEFERPGFVRLDLRNAASIPNSIASRIAAYVSYLNTQRGEISIISNDSQRVSRNVDVLLVPKLNRQIEIRLTSERSGSKESQPMVQTIVAPNPKTASILVGALSALEVANASPATLKVATAMITSLSTVDFGTSNTVRNSEESQLAQAFVETLLASDGLLTGCGEVGSCTKVDVNKVSSAIRAYNQLVTKSNAQVLVALSNNPEFQTLGATLKGLRATIAPKTANR